MIVGAGIAGLTAGWTLRDRKVLVLEATDRVGGRMRSEPRGPYWLNLGAHLFGGPGTLLDRLVAEMGLETPPHPGQPDGTRPPRAHRHQRSSGDLPVPAAAVARRRLSLIRAGLRLRAAARGYLGWLIRVPASSRPRPERASSRTGTATTFAACLGDLHPDVAAIFRAIAERVTAEPTEISAGVVPPSSRSSGVATRRSPAT